jgi:beta,beta-carotene 9',10'-dioxygenase
MPRLVSLLLLGSSAAAAAAAAAGGILEPSSDIETQYDQLFADHPSTLEPTCAPAPGLPEGLNGSFIIPSLGKYGMGVTKMVGVLDGFGKLNRFTLSAGRACLAARMMSTKFWNESVAKGVVAPSLLFYETVPSRKEFFPTLENMMGANDNSYVNTLNMGGVYMGITDTNFAVEFDPVSLAVHADVKWRDVLDTEAMISLGSAHPLPDPTGKPEHAGCILSVRPQRPTLAILRERFEVLVYRMCPEKPTTRVEVAKLPTGKQMAYFHSFGATQHYVVLPLMHVSMDFDKVMAGHPVHDALMPYDVGSNTTVMLLPLDKEASTPIKFQFPGDSYFVHVVNSFERRGPARVGAGVDAAAAYAVQSVVFDVTTYASNFFADTNVSHWANASWRNAPSGRGTIERWEMFLSGDRAGRLVRSPLSIVGRSTDFPKINPMFHAQPYCLYWAVEWFHDDERMSQMAIVRQDVCTGKRMYWHREATFPSEPTFVPGTPSASSSSLSPPSKEDDGVVMFTLLDGRSGRSSLMVINAKTMETISEVHAPANGTIGFSTHGQWYAGLVPQE